MYQQPPHPAASNAPVPASHAPDTATIRAYSAPMLLGLALVYVISLIFLFSDPGLASTSGAAPGVIGSLGTGGLLLVVVTVCVLDWRGFTTMNGVIKWGDMRGWQKFVVGYFFIGLSEFLLAIYFILAARAYLRRRYDAALRQPMETKRKTAQLEASLGIMPVTDGVCRECGKPLQVGADYCAYCAAPVVARPKICPVCATTVLPDAKWCPKCRAALPA